MPDDELKFDAILPNPIGITLKVTDVFESIGVPYLIGGSMASSVHGEPRLTNDVDFVADIKEEQVDALCSVLEVEFYVDELAIRRAIRERSSCNIIYLETMFKIDIFISRGDAWGREQMQRRELRPLITGDESTSRFVASAENIILQKLLWYRKGGEISEKQWNDILGVLKVKAKSLDRDYLSRWSVQLGVADLLEKALVVAST
jgi:hypothetical protein